MCKKKFLDFFQTVLIIFDQTSTIKPAPFRQKITWPTWPQNRATSITQVFKETALMRGAEPQY